LIDSSPMSISNVNGLGGNQNGIVPREGSGVGGVEINGLIGSSSGTIISVSGRVGSSSVALGG